MACVNKVARVRVPGWLGVTGWNVSYLHALISAPLTCLSPLWLMSPTGALEAQGAGGSKRCGVCVFNNEFVLVNVMFYLFFAPMPYTLG